MLARRLLLTVALLLLVLSVASLLAGSDSGGDDAADTPAQATPRPIQTDRVVAMLPAEEPVEAKVGDVLQLTVRTDEAGRAEIRELGVDVPVGPGLETPILVPLERAGRFPVTRRLADEQFGVVSVAPR